MSGSLQDNCQWLSVTEETLFLHDGLIRVTDLVELPRDVNSSHEADNEVISFDLKNPKELSNRLLAVCGTQNNAYTKLLEYRLNALKGYWNAQRQVVLDEQNEREANNNEETLAILKKQGLYKEPEQASFSTRISVLLVIPLLQSQSRIDSSLCGVTSELLLNCLRDCAPLSLSKEPGDCLRGLENLLCSWLGENTSDENVKVVEDQHQRENIASALVALACARGHLKTLIHAVHLLQNLPNLESLHTSDVLGKLLETEGGPGQPTAILGSKHILCWGFEDLLSSTDKENVAVPAGEKDKEKQESELGRSLACDGVFLYTTNSQGKNLAKIGSGLHGTLRGYVYSRNLELGPGKVAYGHRLLIYRPSAFDNEAENSNFCQIIDPSSLKPIKTLLTPHGFKYEGAQTTIGFCSDGRFFFWIWVPILPGDKSAKGIPVYLEMFDVDEEKGAVIPTQSQVTLIKKDEVGAKSLNESFLSKLRPFRGSTSAATLVALTGGDPLSTKKEEPSGAVGSTSCSVSLKNLIRSPMFCDGTTLVIITSPAGTSNSTSTTRSLFGGTLSGLRSLASNMCFNVETGQFNTRSDLSDAPTCALGRGAPLQGLGVCFDVRNNMIWMCSNDWVDQFFNPGHQSPHHIHRRLKVTDQVILPPEGMVPTSVAVRCILQHVGSMCLHQINNDLLHSSLGSCIVQQHSVDVAQLKRIYDILQKAMTVKDDQTIICTLVVMQLILKISLFKLERPAEIQILKETRELLWKLLTSYNTEFKDTQILEEVCHVITVGLPMLYPSNTDKRQLLQTLLFDGRNNEALEMLRDLILVDFADKLRAQAVEKEESKYLRLSDSLVNHILQITVQESSKLLSDATNLDKNNFEEMLSSLPIASPCLRYMMALQSHLLREAVLFKQEENSSPERSKYLQELLMSVVQLASRIFSGSCEVLEVLLATCNNVIHKFKEEREGRLQGLERITKSTILGHLLPVLLTAMNHVNLHCLPLADELMPKLVNLVVLSSQAALLLKSQVEAVMQDDLDSDTDTHVMELMAPTVDIDDMSNDDTEEQGFLAGLKIPAPWSSGKTVESIHPVRDNYRFKETVHIPGARCLYLRFDPRSSSQYDYDKLVIFAGPTTNSKRVLEYGGNTFGFGSRSVLGSGWPKDLVKVDGDTVTFSFEMRSGREHNTPDKAMWGFLVTVRAQESTEEVSSGLPFLADLALGLSVLGCTMLQLLYKGPEKSPQEVNCQHLLKSKLLQRCVWQSGSDPSVPLESPSSPEDTSDSLLARIRLSAEILQNLRKLCRGPAPQLRPSIRDVINPEDLEERVVSTVLKHLSLQETVFKLAKAENQQTEEIMLLRAVIQEVYTKIDSLLRQLQTLAELEQRWHNEVLDQKEGNTTLPPFFSDFHLQETKGKELAMLCFVKEVTVDSDSERAVKNLREKFDDDVSNETFSAAKSVMPRTQHIMKGLRARLDLLLQVTIAPGEGIHVARSVSNNQEKVMGVMVRSDTDVLSQITRSLSVPAGVESFQDDSILDITFKQRKKKTHRRTPSSVLQDLVEGEGRDKPPHTILIEQLFSFIGSNPEKAISPNDFLASAAIRLKRGNTRKQALIHMKELLTAATKVGGATHLVAAVTSVLQSGPCVEELTCGGMVPQVREAFSETMTAVVQLAAKYPIACSNSIGLLCTIPYTRAEEKCLVRSGLVHLLDKLCSLANLRSDTTDTQSVNQKVSTMAWAGFQVLANRCVMWETEDGSQIEELEHSGLARQVSVLLTNHLARATECIGNEAAGTEALQDVLSLLNTLARSRMGRAILSQPACVSKLLSLLLDQRPSPKLVLIILQLCRVALPLMNTADCEQVELPVWGQHLTNTHWNTSEPITDPPAKIVSLLLAKLGDFLVPGDYATLVSRRPSVDLSQGKSKSSDKEKSEESDIQAGKLSVFIHKREDQLSHEVIQPLLGSDNRPFRIGGGANMERVVRMDREMTKLGKAEVTTEDAITALKKAAKWAQMGLVVSTGPPVESGQADTPTGDKKNVRKQPVDVVCREKNTELARTDPIRPFISGHVANNMAAEVIALLHGLLSAPETHTAQSWSEAVQRVLHNSLSCLPLLLASLDSLSSPRCNNRQLMSMSKMANAALCALGGFTEMIKPGCEVKMLGPGIDDSQGTVMSVSEQTGMVTVQLDPEEGEERHPRYSDTIQVPITRVLPVRNEIYKSTSVPVTDSLVMAIKAILLPQDDGTCPLQQNLPLNGDGNSLSNQMSRVVAELQTRACMVLAQYLQDIEFTKEFIQHCGSTIDILKSLAKDCNSGDRQAVVETHCDRLRLLYRDCAKPPPPPSKLDSRANQEMMLDANRSFPPVRASVFSQAMTGVTFLGDPSTGSGLPRGTMIYANQPIPQQAPAFYWELEICSFGDSQEESGAVISFGFAPSADKKDGAWTNPVGTCLFLNNGKAVHYNGASLLQWRSVRLDVALNAGDVAGIGWERTGESPVQGQTPRGRVYFTYNGRRLNAYMDDVSGGMFPVVHIQKKNTRIRANFGTRPFAFAEGQQHKEAADAANDLTREIRESFGHLPFHPHSDSENEDSPQPSPDSSSPEEIQAPKGPPCKTATIPKPQSAYNPDDCLNFKLFSCYDNFVTTGPDHRGPVLQEDESDEEVQEEDNGSEDHYALLVKAWEQKVFPVIRRRFRNEAQRKDGLEQIRGALQLGMTDIARQTVEFLYEENGGIPRDLHLPTIENIKEDLAKFTIEKVRKGTTVVIRNTAETSTAGTTVLPKFAVRNMLKTFGLTGNVLDVDNSNEIVQVEVYLRSEGVLVRFWYPIEMLERPPQGLRKSSITGGQILDTSNIFIHRELLSCESVLAKMYCRTALLKLIDHCNSPAMEIVSCSASSLGSGMAASAALLQQLDIENLQLLSNELLCPPQSHGTVMATSLTTASSLDQCLANQMCSLTKLLYRDEDKLKRELAVAISRAASQGEDYLIELTTQICLCFQTAPEMFPYEEFPVTEVKVNTDLHFPGAGCLVVSCKTDPKAVKKDTSLYKSPWARVFSYTGQRVKKTGSAAKLEVVCYPRDTTSTSNQNEQYTPAIIPTDRVHIRLGVSPPPGIILTIHALPPQFLLAVAYIETLITEKYGCGTRSCGSRESCKMSDSQLAFQNKDIHDSLWSVDNIVISPPVFRHMIELLCRHLWMTNTPAIIKEYLFHLLAQSLRILHYSEGCNSSKLPTLNPHLNPSTGLLVQLQAELRRLYEEETKDWPSGTLVSGSGIGIGVSNKGRFSTYFHALMEVNLAVAELRYEDYFKPPPSLAASSSSNTTLETASSSSLQTLSSPTSSAKRKKLKAKRDKERGGAVPKRTTTQRTSESDSSVSVSSVSSTELVPTPPSSSTAAAAASSSSSGASMATAASEPGKGDPSGTNVKMEDILWLHRAVTVSKILRCLGFKEKHGRRFLSDAISDAAKLLTTPSVASRMLVITGIPPNLSPDTVKQAIRASCNANGGLDRDEIFLPELDVPPDVQQKPSEPSEQESTETSTDQVENIPEETPSKHIKGYAVINVLSKAKLENVKKTLFKNKVLVSSLTQDQEEAGDVPEEMLSVTSVLPTLVGEPHANTAIEEYLQHKFFSDEHQKEMADPATLALTEIFHSCFIMEHKQGSSEVRHESGFICLGKDQILQNVQENLLCVFFNNIRPPKKSLAEQTMHILRRYGMLKSPDKELSPSSDKPGKGKPSKKSPRGSKEKVVLGVVEKVNQKDKKPKGKDFSEKSSKEGATSDPVSTKGAKQSWMPEEAKYLTLDGFLQYVMDSTKQDIRAVWRAILACGFDIHFDRCACIDVSQASHMAGQWTQEMDAALVLHVNSLSRKLAIATALLHPHEIQISEAVLSSEKFNCLQGVPLESIRLRFALLQSLNNTLETFYLPLVDLRPAQIYNRSTAALLSMLRGLVFYDTKINLMNRVLNATEQRKPDQAAPEITLDPLETILKVEKSCLATWLCQAYRQLLSIPSRQFCVRLASGGDPTYAFNVRLTGEEVHGTSGSFRQFLWQAAKEVSGSLLRLLIPCNNSDKKGRYIFRPGPMSFSEERLLQFFGQLLGITMRADIPLGLDMLPCVWKLLVGAALDPVTDLKEADLLTYSYIKKIEMVETESELQALCSGVFSRFMYSSLAGEEVELINKGDTVQVCWENRQEYVDAIRGLRFQELLCEDRVRAVHCGIASIIPLQFMALMSPLDLEIRTSGLPLVDLDFLKAHTMYQVGLMETDQHIQFFWNTLSGLSQEDLGKFIKFACNQERIPQTCPCRDGNADSMHVPPYPMKIAPPDGAGQPDGRYIRVETCMFMIKLPQYSSQEIMTQQLMYAINCREDPLSG